MTITPLQFTITLLVLVGFIQAGGALGYWLYGRPGMATMFVGFVIGNCGLIYDILHT